MQKILFICSGNLCRSPMALSVFNTRIGRLGVKNLFKADSAGSHAGRLSGQPADPRSVDCIARRGYSSLSKHRARKFTLQDFGNFDFILAMDSINLQFLKDRCPTHVKPKISLLLDFVTELNSADIPDPYYGNIAGFERVLDLCEAGVDGFIRRFTEDMIKT